MNLGLILSIIYSTLLNLRLPKNQSQPSLPSLPLRHSNLFNLLTHLIFESIFISRLSHDTLSSFGACLHLLKIPLLSTTYQYFNIGFKSEICKSLSFDLINYLGQFCLFYVISKSTNTPNLNDSKKDEITIIQTEKSTTYQSQEESNQTVTKTIDQKERKDEIKIKKSQTHAILMSLLTWILISLIDGLVNFVFEKFLSPKIHADVRDHIRKLKLDQYFLLNSSGSTLPPEETLRAIPPRDRTMIEHQFISPLINLPYFFSSASLISLPSDFIWLDRLPMLSFNTKFFWLSGLIFKRLLNSSIAYFLTT